MNALRPFFAQTSPSSIKYTFNVTTRHGTAPHTQDYIKKHFKSRNPVFNIPRRSEAVATVIQFPPKMDENWLRYELLQQTPSSLTLLLLMMVPPWPNSSVAVILLSVMPMVSNQPNNSSTLSLTTSENEEPWIPTSVMEANMKSPSKSLIVSIPYSSKIISLNPIINTKTRLKIVLDTVMNTSGCPVFCWLLCLQYICVVLNHLASPTLQGICPVQTLQGTTPDVSFMLHFSFYEPVYYRIDSYET